MSAKQVQHGTKMEVTWAKRQDSTVAQPSKGKYVGILRTRTSIALSSHRLGGLSRRGRPAQMPSGTVWEYPKRNKGPSAFVRLVVSPKIRREGTGDVLRKQGGD